MFYNKYSDYFPEQIITENYKKLSEQFLSIIQNEQIKEKIKRYII